MVTNGRWMHASLMIALIAAGAGSASAQTLPSSASRPAAVAKRTAAALVTLHVDQNDAAVMHLALNNAQNIISHYKALARPVKIEIVTYGPGLNMLRSDKSPVKARIESMALEQPGVTFIACGNTRDNMAKAESAPVPLMSEAKVVPSGVIRLIELQNQGYAYIKP